MQLQNFKEMPIAEAMAAIERNKDNPSLMPSVFMDLINDITDGKVNFVDATNPTVLLMEMMALGIVSGVKENAASLRRRYPNLAETPEDLSDHVSDWVMTNRFAIPSKEPFRIYIGFNAFKTNAVRDESEKCVKVIIPRDTYLFKDGREFTLNYPIVIRLFDIGNLQVAYDTSVPSRLQSLRTNIIQYQILKTPDDVAYITFQVEVMQMKIERYTDNTTSGEYFAREYAFTDQFFSARAFYRNSQTGNKWKEMETTHGRMNYDRRDPTMLLRVDEGRLRVELPQVYMLHNRLLGEIAVDIYTTKGNLNEPLRDEVYEIAFRALDPDELNNYTPQALSEIPRMAKPEGTLTGGRDGLTFEQYRQRVIFNDTGPQVTPISPTSIESSIEDEGFEVNKYSDIATERVFFASRKLPAPINSKLITSANIGIQTFVSSKEDMVDHPYVFTNGDRWTMDPRNLYILENGQIRLLTTLEIKHLEMMEISKKITELNSKQFLYTPFHYVFDANNSEFDLRAYYLDQPKSDVISFVRNNPTLQLEVYSNNDERSFYRTPEGYQLRIKLTSGNFFKKLSDNQVGMQLRYTPHGDSSYVYIKGRQLGLSDENRVFVFDFKTNFDLDESDSLRINGVSVNGTDGQYAWTNLTTQCDLFIVTNAINTGYESDDTIREYASWLNGTDFVPITHETITLEFGKPLKTLWRRARNLVGSYGFKKWTTTVQKVYKEDVYKKDPIKGTVWVTNPTTGRPERVLEHARGDLVFDPVTGEPIYEHQVGDVIKGDDGLPIEDDVWVQRKEADILFIDGRHYFVTDPLYLEYNQELTDILVDWITDTLLDIQGRCLEKTKVFFHPKAQMGPVRIDYGDGRYTTIQSEQSPRIDIYLPKAVYEDKAMRSTIINQSVRILDEALKGDELDHSLITKSLKEVYGSTVTSFRLYGFGPKRDIYYATVQDIGRTLTLKRIIEPQADGTLTMKEDVTFNFYLANRT